MHKGVLNLAYAYLYRLADIRAKHVGCNFERELPRQRHFEPKQCSRTIIRIGLPSPGLS